MYKALGHYTILALALISGYACVDKAIRVISFAFSHPSNYLMPIDIPGILMVHIPRWVAVGPVIASFTLLIASLLTFSRRARLSNILLAVTLLTFAIDHLILTYSLSLPYYYFLGA